MSATEGFYAVLIIADLAVVGFCIANMAHEKRFIWPLTFAISLIIWALFTWPAHAFSSQPTYPDPVLTPGVFDDNVTQSSVQKTICKANETAEVRRVTEKMKREVFARYHLDYDKLRKAYEVDHFIPLCVGGANDIENLWPQRWSPKPGAREKDIVESHLHKKICEGDLSLDEAQEIIKQDWYSCYQAIQKNQECEVIPEE